MVLGNRPVQDCRNFGGVHGNLIWGNVEAKKGSVCGMKLTFFGFDEKVVLKLAK